MTENRSFLDSDMMDISSSRTKTNLPLHSDDADFFNIQHDEQQTILTSLPSSSSTTRQPPRKSAIAQRVKDRNKGNEGTGDDEGNGQGRFSSSSNELLRSQESDEHTQQNRRENRVRMHQSTEMDEKGQKAIARYAMIGEYFNLTFAKNDGSPWQHKAAVVEKREKSEDGSDVVFFRLFNGHKATGLLLHFPTFCEDDDREEKLIFKDVERTKRPVRLLPPNLRHSIENINTDEYRFIFYVDGGAKKAQGEGAGAAGAAFVLIDRDAGTIFSCGRYYPHSTNQKMEFISMVAAMRYARENFAGEKCLFIGDNEMVFSAISNANEPKDLSIKCLYTQAMKCKCGLFAFAHMMRKYDNPADEVCKRCSDGSIDVGDVMDWFMDAPEEISSAPSFLRRDGFVIQHEIDVKNVEQLIDETVAQISSAKDWSRVRHFHSRSRVPRGLEAEWSIIVTNQLKRITGAASRDERSKHAIGLLLLPTLFLPMNRSVRNISAHMQRHQPFSVNLKPGKKDERTKPRDPRSGLSLRVERHVQNYNISRAVKMMQANSEGERPDFDTQLEALKKKFPMRKPEDAVKIKEAVYVAPFSKNDVCNSLKKMSKTAATAIDGWTKELWEQAITQNGEIAEMLGVILSQISKSHGTQEQISKTGEILYNRQFMDIIRAGRLVGIPKPDDPKGVRPIVISSFFSKLIGSMIYRRSGVRSLRNQFAISQRNGAHKVIHKVRERYNQGWAIIRLDSSNAFNITKRKYIQERLEELYKNGDVNHQDMLQWFQTAYEGASDLFVYGPDGRIESIKSDEGSRQGDALSALYFCLIMECFSDDLLKEFPDLKGILEVLCYMDDATICVRPEHLWRVAPAALRFMEKHGFKINVEKSSIICKDDLNEIPPSFGIPIVKSTEPFKVLGANMTENYTEMNTMLKKRTSKFFDDFDELEVHPEIQHVILHYCGSPKLLYFCSTTPAEHSAEVTKFFGARIKRSFAKLIQVAETKIKDNVFHADEGAGIPDYHSCRGELYLQSLAQVKGSYNQSVARVKLTKPIFSISPDDDNERNDPERDATYDSQWMRYSQAPFHEQLSPNEYRVALALRCDVIPDSLYNNETYRCECNTMIQSARDVISHALRCHLFSGITAGNRHQWLKQALGNVYRSWGGNISIEPGFYTYENTDVKHRPDITFYTNSKAVCTDLSIVSPDVDFDNARRGAAASRQAKAKSKHHQAAVSKMEHVFIPFVMETSGHFDRDCFKMITALSDIARGPRARHVFKRDLIGAASTSIAKFRSEAILKACLRIRNLNARTL